LTTETRPQVNGKDVAMTVTIDHAYRGDRSFGDYLRVYLAPFLLIIRFPLLAIFVVAVVGYGASRLMDRAFANAERRAAPRVAMWLLVATPPLMFVLIYGVGDILLMTDTRRWGGLMLTVLIAMVAILLSFPLGILLALGRRSRLPVIKIASTIYIEFVRGVPFITILFMAQLLVPLINPSLAAVSNVFRAMIGAILFSAAYLAENVRGGLQAVSHGQEEAAKAIGLATWQIVVYITLPQALRAVIPALVGSFISLLIDTSLVAIVGLIDLTGIAQTVVAQTEFLGARREVFIFITAIYFLFAISMSRVSRRIETSGVGTVVKQEL
jgi:general L-amino acid transport system permease protein